MSLIIILLGLFLDRTFEQLRGLRRFEWFGKYSKWMLQHIPGLNAMGASSIVLLLFPVMLVVLLLQNWLDNALFDIFSFVIGLAIFVYCLCPADLDHDIDNYLEARTSGNEEEAQKFATRLMGKTASASPDQQSIEVMQAILTQANSRIFSVIFWFILLGPFGALLYRLTHLSMQSTNSQVTSGARKLEAMMAWAPAHLVAIGYALTGSYEGASEAYREKSQEEDLSECNSLTLVSAGFGALRECHPGEETACIRATRGLVLRTLIVWLASIAVLTLIGWMA